MVTSISARGVNHGLEFTNRWRAPALLAVLLLLVAYSLTTGDVTKGLEFAFQPDFSRLTPSVLLDAVGQAFYALGICVGVMMVYGSYMPANQPFRPKRDGRDWFDSAGLQASPHWSFSRWFSAMASIQRVGQSWFFRSFQRHLRNARRADRSAPFSLHCWCWRR
jgi:hypothetical protein